MTRFKKIGLLAFMVAAFTMAPVDVRVADGAAEMAVATCDGASCRPMEDWVCNLNGEKDHDGKCDTDDDGCGDA